MKNIIKKSNIIPKISNQKSGKNPKFPEQSTKKLNIFKIVKKIFKINNKFLHNRFAWHQ